MAKNPGFFAYLGDGTQIRFRHAVDFMSALRTGKMFANPPGTPAPEEKKAPEGEKIDGVESMKPAAAAPAEVVEGATAATQAGGGDPAPAAGKKKATTKIKR